MGRQGARGRGAENAREGGSRAAGRPVCVPFVGVCLRARGPVLALALTALAALALASAPAMALSQRGHVFSLSFGGAGKGESQFERPAGIAVEDATGDFYVADRGNNRVLEFEPQLSDGEPTAPKQIGELKVPDPLYVAVDNSTSATDQSKGDVYVVGARSSEKNEPEPSAFFVYKFGPTGTFITKLTKFKPKKSSEEKEFEVINGVAVGPTGSLYVDQEEAVYEFGNEEKNHAVGSVKSSAGASAPGLADDAEGNLYLGVPELEESTGASEAEIEQTERIKETDEDAGLVNSEHFEVITEIDGATGSAVHPELDAEYSPALAVNQGVVAKSSEEQKQIEEALQVDERDDVYVANAASIGGQPSTTIAEFNPEHQLVQRFGATGLKLADGIGVDPQTGIVYVADAQADDVDIFQLEPAGAPTVGGLTACTIGGGPHCPIATDAETLKAQVDPEGAETTYQFEYGPGSCPGPECVVTPEGHAGSGFASVEVDHELPELAAGVWHYRVVATNKGKDGELRSARSAEGTFTIVSPTSGLPEGRQWELVTPAVHKEGEDGEPLPMPAVGGAIQASENGNAITYVASGPLGKNVEGSRSPERTQVLSTIGPREWSSEDVTTRNNFASGYKPGLPAEYELFSPDLALALLQPYPGGEKTGALAEPPLSPPVLEKEQQEKTIYLRDDAPEELLSPGASATERENYEQAKANGKTMGNPGYLALVTAANAPGGEPFGGPENFTYEGLALTGAATPDLSHVVFESYRAAPGIYEWGPRESCSNNGTPKLLACTGGDVQPVSVLPDGKLLPPVSEATVEESATVGGGEGRNVRHAISDDGDLVFWSATIDHESRLYVRDSVTKETLRLDAVQSGAGRGQANPEFQTASADGSKVFFTDTQALTRESHAGEDRPDLYVAELSGGREPKSPLTYALTDLTPYGVHGESADIQGMAVANNDAGVLGASEDGSYVYYVANGALTPEAPPGDCVQDNAAPGLTCNLYVSHYAAKQWTTTLVAPLSAEDYPDWGDGGITGDLTFMTSSVSPDGQYLAFMSDRSLTGYDNEDVTSEKPGQRLDEEVYLYDASSGSLVCASCKPDGARPEGIDDAGEPVPLAVDESGVWSAGGGKTDDHWLAGSVPGWTPIAEFKKALYQPRYLSDSGRLFFDSADNLVPAAESHAEKVYEFEPDTVGTCTLAGGCVGLISSGSSERESVFIDASAEAGAEGNDVFFITAAHLVQQATGEGVAVYDARVCEPSSRCLPPPAGSASECESAQACERGYTPSSSTEAPASTIASASPSVSAQHEVLGEKVVSQPPAKPLTQAQKLAKALKACKTKYKHAKGRRLACERRVRRTYGPRQAVKARRASRGGGPR